LSPDLSKAFSLDCVLKNSGWDTSAEYFRLILSFLNPLIFLLIMLLLHFHSLKTKKTNSIILAETYK